MLPDHVLLEIFDFYPNSHHSTMRTTVSWRSNWHILVHVCRRWRQIVFSSPHRLSLRIICVDGTPVRKHLGIWPDFPIVILNFGLSGTDIFSNDEDNVIAALEHSDRVCYIGLNVTCSQLGKLAAVMQEPFPVLTHLIIGSWDGNTPVLPAEFLGGSAPCLQEVSIFGIPYPTLPTLLLSAGDLVELYLDNIPPTGYISPEAMVVGLAALPRLHTFHIGFRSPASRPDRIRPPPITRTVLPALTSFRFHGASEYLEDLVSRINSPQLNQISIFYLNQLVDFQVAQLSKFIESPVGPKLTLFRHAQVRFYTNSVILDMYHHANDLEDYPPAKIVISCQGIDWQTSHIAQVLSHFHATHSTVAHLKLDVRLGLDRQLEGVDDNELFLLLHQFSTVQTLHVSQGLAGPVALALEDIPAVMVTEVLPSLDLIRLAGQPPSSVKKFVAARRLSNRPVTVIDTKTEFDERLESYVIE